MNKSILYIFCFIFLFGCVTNSNLEIDPSNNMTNNVTLNNSITNISSNISNVFLPEIHNVTLNIGENYIYDHINITFSDIETFSNSALIRIYYNDKTYYEKINLSEQKIIYLPDHNLKIDLKELGCGYTLSAKWAKFSFQFSNSDNSIEEYSLLETGDFLEIDEWKILFDDISYDGKLYALFSIYVKNGTNYSFYDYEKLYEKENKQIILNNEIYEFNSFEIVRGYLMNDLWIKLKINNTNIPFEKDEYIILNLGEEYYYYGHNKISFESNSFYNNKILLNFYSTNLVIDSNVEDAWQGSFLMKNNDELVRPAQNKFFSFNLIDSGKSIYYDWIKLKIYETNKSQSGLVDMFTTEHYGNDGIEYVFMYGDYQVNFALDDVANDRIMIKSYDNLGLVYYDIIEINQTLVRSFVYGNYNITVKEIFDGFPISSAIIKIERTNNPPSIYFEPYIMGNNVSINDNKNILMNLRDIDSFGNVLVNVMYENGTIISKELLKRKNANIITFDDEKYLVTNVDSFGSYVIGSKLIKLLITEFKYETPIDNNEYLISGCYDLGEEIVFDDFKVLFEDIEINSPLNKKAILLNVNYENNNFKEKIFEGEKMDLTIGNNTYEIYVSTIAAGYSLNEKWAKINIK